jgi:hypothetical protein
MPLVTIKIREVREIKNYNGMLKVLFHDMAKFLINTNERILLLGRLKI